MSAVCVENSSVFKPLLTLISMRTPMRILPPVDEQKVPQR
jgi:hypothetical protein